MIVPVSAGLGEVRSKWIGRTARINHRYSIEATPAKRFTCSTIGQLAAIGRRTGVAKKLAAIPTFSASSVACVPSPPIQPNRAVCRYPHSSPLSKGNPTTFGVA